MSDLGSDDRVNVGCRDAGNIAAKAVSVAMESMPFSLGH
jgi:hypothetical protein